MTRPSTGTLLPRESLAERRVAAASTAHCTAHAVLGDGPGRRFQAESHLELCHLQLLGSMRNVTGLREQVRLAYGPDPDRPSVHVFDIVADLDCGARVAFAVKPRARLRSGRFPALMREVAWWVRELRFADAVRILTEADLDPVDLHNARTLAAVRGTDPEADAAALETAAALPPGGRTLRDLASGTGLGARGHRALLRLMADGVLRQRGRGALGPGSILVCAAGLPPRGPICPPPRRLP